MTIYKRREGLHKSKVSGSTQCSSLSMADSKANNSQNTQRLSKRMEHSFLGATANSIRRLSLGLGPRPWMLLLALVLLITHSNGAFIVFENCLGPRITHTNSTPPLQFDPIYAWTGFDTSSSTHSLNLTVYGNVSGIATIQPYPNADDPQWTNPNETVGKIPDYAGSPGSEKYTTFATSLKVLGYTPYNPPDTRLCNSSALTPCPFAPVFHPDDNE